MERYYVDITGISLSQLEFAGYVVVFQDDDFQLLSHKGDMHLVDKQKPNLFVDDRCDADLLRDLRDRERIPLAPDGESIN